MSNCPFAVEDRVCAPADLSGRLHPGTVTDKRDHRTPPTLEGYSETIPQVRVRLDEAALDERWLDCRQVKPMPDC